MKPAIIVYILIICSSLSSASSYARQAAPQPLTMKVAYTPQPEMISGKNTLVYEIHLTNHATQLLHIKQLEVINTADSSVITACKGAQVVSRMYDTSTKPGSDATDILRPGATAWVYMEVELPAGKIPDTVMHRISYVAEGASSKQHVFTGATTKIINKPAIVLGPPVAGGPWAAVHDPSWKQGHRRMIFVKNGTARIPARFAIDFIKLDSAGKYSGSNDQDSVKNWYSYGIPVLAVADGVVSTTKTDFPESATLAGHPRYTADQASGNYVSLKIAAGVYAFYEHLQPASIIVKPGQPVKKGEMIARVGFTGQSTGPHLHFHIAGADACLAAEGLPFVFEQFTLSGSYPNFDLFGKSPWEKVNGTAGKPVNKEHPSYNSVIVF